MHKHNAPKMMQQEVQMELQMTGNIKCCRNANANKKQSTGTAGDINNE